MARDSCSSSTSSMGDAGVRRRVVCKCGVASPLVTSWSKENPGRRFYGCGRYEEDGRRKCTFFIWHDNEANARDKKLIAALLRKLDGMNKKISWVIRICVVGWVLFALVLFAFIMQCFKKV
ncbi:hypothetical protein OROGR_006421 [Orobanche gracilis]